MRLRIPEIDQHAVAHVFGEIASKARGLLRNATVIGAEDLTQVFGVVARGPRRRTDEIAEHHRQLAPHRLGGRRGNALCRLHVAKSGGDRRQQLASMADRGDAEVPQVLGGQVTQHLGIDRVPAKRLILRVVNTIRIGAAAADHKKPLAATSRDHKSDAGAEDIPMRSGL